MKETVLPRHWLMMIGVAQIDRGDLFNMKNFNQL